MDDDTKNVRFWPSDMQGHHFKICALYKYLTVAFEVVLHSIFWEREARWKRNDMTVALFNQKINGNEIVSWSQRILRFGRKNDIFVHCISLGYFQ